jgi:hypothetical protein
MNESFEKLQFLIEKWSLYILYFIDNKQERDSGSRAGITG